MDDVKGVTGPVYDLRDGTYRYPSIQRMII